MRRRASRLTALDGGRPADQARTGAVVTAESTSLAGESRREPDRRGVVSRGPQVYLRTLRPEDLEYLSEWAEDAFVARMVGSEFLNAYKHVYDKDPSFFDAVLMDTTQVVLMVEANRGRTKPLGLARLFNIHLLEGYGFLEVVLTEQKALRRGFGVERSEEHTSELQSRPHLVCRLL